MIFVYLGRGWWWWLCRDLVQRRWWRKTEIRHRLTWPQTQRRPTPIRHDWLDLKHTRHIQLRTHLLLFTLRRLDLLFSLSPKEDSIFRSKSTSETSTKKDHDVFPFWPKSNHPIHNKHVWGAYRFLKCHIKGRFSSFMHFIYLFLFGFLRNPC